MGESAISLRDGVLSHLENLEASSHQVAPEEEEDMEDEEESLKKRIEELRYQRDVLKAKLSMSCSGITNGKDSTQSIKTPPATDANTQAVLEWKVDNIKDLLEVFPLTGISGELTREGACLCITTAFESTYLDSYYLYLRIRQPVQIQHHTVPAFIPLKQIADEYLQTDVKRFFSVLSDHLNAYVGRKFQAEQLQERFAAFLTGPLQGNSLYNLLEFSYGVEPGGKTFPFSAKLAYGNPMGILPTEANVTCKEDAAASEVEMAARHQALFHEKPLHEIFRSFADSTENLS